MTQPSDVNTGQHISQRRMVRRDQDDRNTTEITNSVSHENVQNMQSMQRQNYNLPHNANVNTNPHQQNVQNTNLDIVHMRQQQWKELDFQLTERFRELINKEVNFQNLFQKMQFIHKINSYINNINNYKSNIQLNPNIDVNCQSLNILDARCKRLCAIQSVLNYNIGKKPQKIEEEKMLWLQNAVKTFLANSTGNPQNPQYGEYLKDKVIKCCLRALGLDLEQKKF